MKITRQRLKEIIKEETYKVLTKNQDQARKDAKSRSLERKRNWIPGLSLGRGIAEGDEDGEDVELFTEEFKTVMKELEEDRVLNPTVFKKRCMKLGMRSIDDFMKLQNLLKRSQDGELVPKPATKEELNLVDEENKCGNPARNWKTGHFSHDKDKGVHSTYFCDKQPRKKLPQGSLPNPRDCGRSARMEKPSKDRPCHPDNPKHKKKRKIKETV